MAGPSKGSDVVDEVTAPEAVMTVMRLYRALERVDTGLTPQQYRILKLAGAGEERSARLAERLAVAKPTLSAAADGLVAAGYVKREAQPGDRRVVRLCLTATGRGALELADAAYATWLGKLLGFTGDPDGMLRALRALDAAMDERRRARLAELNQPAELRQDAELSQPAEVSHAARLNQAAELSHAPGQHQASEQPGERRRPAVSAKKNAPGAAALPARAAGAGPA